MRRFAKGIRKRHTPGTMNGQEREYAGMLEERKSRGEIAAVWFETFTFKLAPDTRYTPDFVVMLADGTMEAHEVKGFMEDDAWVKLKVAAELIPFAFVLAKKKAKKDGGGWAITRVGGEEASK